MLHIIQNDRNVPPGNITEHLDALKIVYAVHHPYRGDLLPELQDISALIVLGGAMGANDDVRYPFLRGLKDLIRQVVAAGIPFLGICLGGQLLAAACGAQVVANRWDEVGNLPVELLPAGQGDPLFAGLTRQFISFQWHHDSFDLPAGSVLLASSPACPHQAFRIGACAWATQFHPEVTEQIIRAWCALDRTAAGRADELAAVFCSRENEYRAVSQLILGNFLSAGMCRSETL
jgi:GMP synthase-like glutamine amidotransferase